MLQQRPVENPPELSLTARYLASLAWRSSFASPRPAVAQSAASVGDAAPPGAQPDTEALVSALTLLGAESAAARAFAMPPSSETLRNGSWRASLQLLLQHGFAGAEINELLSRWMEALAPRYAGRLPSLMHTLTGTLQLRAERARRIVCERPLLLGIEPEAARATVDELLADGLRAPRDFAHTLLPRWPGVLAVAPQQVRAVSAILTEPPPRGCGFGGWRGEEDGAVNDRSARRASLGSLLRRAPWLLTYSPAADIAPVVRFLYYDAGVRDLERVVRAYPQVLGCRTAQLSAAVHFLRDDIGIASSDELAAVIQTFPACLDLPLERQLRPVAQYLRALGIAGHELARCVRAFPSLLSLSIEHEMEPVVAFLRRRGVRDVCRMVKRLPPILGSDVERDLALKLDFLEAEMKLDVFDVARFPAYFSYPFAEIIRPRLLFLKRAGVSLRRVGLNLSLALAQREFCTRVARVSESEYEAFVRDLQERDRHARATASAREKRQAQRGWNETESGNEWQPPGSDGSDGSNEDGDNDDDKARWAGVRVPPTPGREPASRRALQMRSSGFARQRAMQQTLTMRPTQAPAPAPAPADHDDDSLRNGDREDDLDDVDEGETERVRTPTDGERIRPRQHRQRRRNVQPYARQRHARRFGSWERQRPYENRDGDDET